MEIEVWPSGEHTKRLDHQSKGNAGGQGNEMQRACHSVVRPKYVEISPSALCGFARLDELFGGH